MTAPVHESDHSSMTRTYVAVLVVEAIVLVLLWLLGRTYA